MNFKRLLAALFSLLAIANFIACSDDDPTTPEPISDVLLTIEFDEFTPYPFVDQGYVFASDSAGNVLAVATWSGPSTVVLKNGSIHPETISFTIFQSTNERLRLETEYGVPVGSTRTMSTVKWPSESGSTEVEFLNTPPCTKFRMAANSYSATGWTEFPDHSWFPVIGDSTDLFVRVDPVDGDPIGGWLRDLKVGEIDTFDFEVPGVVLPLSKTEVQIPTDAIDGFCSVKGIVVSDPSYHPFRLESVSFENPIPQSISLYIPVEVASENLITTFYQDAKGSPKPFYWQEATGPIPTSFANLEGELSVISASPDSLVFSTTSEWDWLIGAWRQEGAHSCIWRVEGPAPDLTFTLPQIPAEIADQFPEDPREEYVLGFWEIYQATSENLVRSQGKSFSYNKESASPLTRFDIRPGIRPGSSVHPHRGQ